MRSSLYGSRIYIDMGIEETTLWEYHWLLYDLFLDDGYVVNDDLKSVIGCGHEHSEWAWDLRLPAIFAFLLNSGDEPNLLTQTDYPPVVSATALSNGTFALTSDSLKGRQYRLDRAIDLMDPQWQGVATSRSGGVDVVNHNTLGHVVAVGQHNLLPYGQRAVAVKRCGLLLLDDDVV